MLGGGPPMNWAPDNSRTLILNKRHSVIWSVRQSTLRERPRACVGPSRVKAWLQLPADVSAVVDVRG